MRHSVFGPLNFSDQIRTASTFEPLPGNGVIFQKKYMLDFIEKIKSNLEKPLPGRDAQLKMAPLSRHRKMDVPDHARQAAVMATLFPKEDEWNIIFIKRNPNDRDRHGGQISFPGGKVEAEDNTFLDTALRETEEEIGIPQNDIQVLGALTELYIPVSNFQVFPYLGFMEKEPTYQLQEEEVSGILEVPFPHFENPANSRLIDLPVNDVLTMKNVPYFDIHGKVLWGATAMMMSELLALTQVSDAFEASLK